LADKVLLAAMLLAAGVVKRSQHWYEVKYSIKGRGDERHDLSQGCLANFCRNDLGDRRRLSPG
jgi:hypothetical protein